MNYHRALVFLSAFLCYAISGGYVYGQSRLLSSIAETFNTTRAQACVIQSTTAAIFCGFSVVSGAMAQRFGPKIVGILAAVGSGFAIGLSYLASSVLFLVIIQAVFNGIGSSMINISCNSVISNNFEGKARMLALSILLCGGGTGGMLYSYLLQYLVAEYGLRGTYLIVGGILWNMLALILIWPAEETRNNVHAKHNDSSVNSYTNKIAANRMSLKASIKDVLGMKKFVLFAFGVAITSVSQITILIYVSDMTVDRYQSYSTASFAVFMYNLWSIFGRLALGVLKQLPCSTQYVVPVSTTILCVTGSFVLAYMENEVLTLIACCLVGLSFGVNGASMVVITVELIGKQRLPFGLGFILTISGLGSLVTGPATGYIRDITGSYTGVYVATAAVACVGGTFLFGAISTRKPQTPAEDDHI